MPAVRIGVAYTNGSSLALEALGARGSDWYPRRDSNARHRLRRPVLYPLSYGGS